MKFCTCKRQSWKKIFLTKILNFFSIVKFIYDVFKTFVTTWCYSNDEDCELFKFFFFFSIEYVDGLCVIFTILHIKKENFKINIKNGNLLLNRGSKSMFIELLMYFYTMIQQPINCILMGLILSFYVWNSN
jgi:hypothetical protein